VAIRSLVTGHRVQRLQQLLRVHVVVLLAGRRRVVRGVDQRLHDGGLVLAQPLHRAVGGLVGGQPGLHDGQVDAAARACAGDPIDGALVHEALHDVLQDVAGAARLGPGRERVDARLHLPREPLDHLLHVRGGNDPRADCALTEATAGGHAAVPPGLQHLTAEPGDGRRLPAVRPDLLRSLVVHVHRPARELGRLALKHVGLVHVAAAALAGARADDVELHRSVVAEQRPGLGLQDTDGSGLADAQALVRGQRRLLDSSEGAHGCGS
jgi:hypothetical protein